jgi:Mce-associated membrane protein
MSSEKPVSDPLEPEGTGVPADAAAEHAPSGNDETDAAPSSGAAENKADTAAAETGAADATVRPGKAASPDSTAERTRSASAAEADTVGAGTAGDEKTVVIGKAGAADDDTVVVDKAGAGATAAGGAESGATVAASESEAATEKVDIGKKSTAAEEDAEAGAKPGAADAATSTGRRSPFPLPALIGAAVLLVAALVAVGVFFFLAGNKQDELDRRAAATKAACDFGNNFATYTGDKADDYIQRLDRSATGEWKKLVSQIGPDLKTRFAESKVSSTANGVQCGYESGSGDEARVVLVIDQQFTTANVPQEQGPGQVKVAANVSMQKVDGTWLVADFDTPMMQQ